MINPKTPRPIPLAYRNATPQDEAESLALLERSFGFPHEPSLWQWLFVRNSSQAPMFYRVADAGDRLAGQYATMPVRLQHSNRKILALLTLHVATDPDFTRRGIFTNLAKQLYDEAARKAPVVYGFPNRTSAPGFFGKLGWVHLRPHPLYTRPLGNTYMPLAASGSALAPVGRIADVIARVGLVVPWMRARLRVRREVQIVPLQNFGKWADHLWEALRTDLGTCAIRDADFLRWRFLEGPFSYRIYGVDRGSGPVGFAVLSCRPWRGGHSADLMELMAPKDDREGADLLLANAILDAWSQGAIALRAIVSARHPHRRAFLKAGFLPVPRPLKRGYSSSFGVCVLDPSQVIPNEILHIDDWYISGADLDYI